jgi:saccharopine dehydrogenase (NAD+, L-lysine-forming)
MSKVLVIGAGGVSSVCVHKMAMNSGIFPEIHLASRTKSKCDAIAASVKTRTGVTVPTYEIDAEEVPAMVNLIKTIGATHVINLALPYQDLPIMDACLEAGAHYLDTANYEPKDEAKFEYKWQWAYHDRFKEAGLMALLGSGFDPGVTSVFTMWLKKHKLKTIRTLDILDCNGGDHGQAFATNFNPEINIREVTAPARHWENGEWVETPAMQVSTPFDFEEVGTRQAYLMYHEELESLSKFNPEMERARFWMTFGDEYIKHLTVLQNVGMTSIEPVRYQGREIIPLQFLAAVLPKPETLGETTKGNTNIGVIATGEALDGSGEKTFYINNICSHEAAYEETGNQAVSTPPACPQ